ncbi:hypothetical protein NMG60_11009167 [Bertholletia excelsa]
MEMKTPVKSQESSARRRPCEVDGDAPVTKCVKRRRREPSTVSLGCRDQGKEQQPQPQQVDHSPIATTVKRSSRFRGVSRHRWTGRYEAHLWDKMSWNATQRKKGKQGAYVEEESAAIAYDLAAIKYWGPSTHTNFPISDYEREIEIMQNVTKEEYLASLRRRSSGFSRGASKYRGVARHHHNGRWEARIGRVFGNKYLYLGTYSTQEEAAHAYDIAAIEYRGIKAVTNFDLSTYFRYLRSGASSDRTHNMNQYLPVNTSSNGISFGESESSLRASTSASASTNRYSIENSENTLQRQILETTMPISPCRKSPSPTALGLLLKSSLFKELVEKNSNVTDDDEAEQRDMKNQSEVGVSCEPVEGIFYNGVGNIPYGCCSNNETLSGLESLENKTLTLLDETEQSLWAVSGAFDMPSN